MTRKLVVFDPTDKAIHVVDPQAAPGVAVPAFRYGQTRPAAGSVKGEAFIDQNTGIASVWDSSKWTDIAVPVVVPYPDDNALLASKPPLKTVGLSEATGNMFTYLQSGWVPMGIRVYPTQAGLTSDTPADGTLAFAQDTGDFALRTNNNWAALAHQGVNVGNTAPANPVQADMWLDTTTATDPILKFYDGTNWVATGAQVSVGTRPANPAPGDIYFNLNRAGRLEIFHNNQWQQVVTTTYKRGTLANRPDWNHSDYGDFYEDSDTGTLYFAGKDRWIMLNPGGLDGAKTNATASNTNFKSHIFRPPDGKLSIYEGHVYGPRNKSIQVCIREGSDTVPGSEFDLMVLSTLFYDNDSTTRIDGKYHQGGDGYWDLVYGKTSNYAATLRFVVDRLADSHDVLSCVIFHRNHSGTYCRCEWMANIAKSKWDYFYFTGFNGEDPRYIIRQTF